MRNTPSFIGEFSKHKPKPSTSHSSSELPIEKEADLREKRKQILQRLKHRTEHENIVETGISSHAVVPNGEISEKVIFSPRTAKRFQQASHKRGENAAEINRLKPPDMPTIVLQEDNTAENHQSNEGLQRQTKEFSQPTAKQANEPTYVPSFADKSKPLRKAQLVSPNLSRRVKTSPKLLKKTNSALAEIQTRERKTSNSQSPKHERKVLKNSLPSQKPPLLASSSMEATDADTSESSPLRRSASFHTLKDKNEWRKSEGRQFLGVHDRDQKTSSLPSIRLQSSSLTSLVDYNDLSSTKSLKLQQDRLEEDFHKLEEDLDRAFSELRKYLRTS